MGERLMIYGASGSTGERMVRMAVERGFRPVLSGRSAAALGALAEELGLRCRPAHLGETGRLIASLRDVAVLVNAAGPMSITWRPLVEACLRTGTHYLDVTGELPVFEVLFAWRHRAAARGVLLMPGVGFLVVTTDCLAAHVVRRLPRAHSLYLGLARSPSISQGSFRTVLSLASNHTRVRQGGKLVDLPLGSRCRTFDFGQGERQAVSLPFGDVFTAGLTTGVPNVEAYIETNPAERLLWLGGRFAGNLFRSPVWRALLESQAGSRSPRSEEAVAAKHTQVVVAEAEAPDGSKVLARLETPEAYRFTAAAALEVAARVLGGDLATGFRTPAGLYGADFVLGIDGALRRDLR